MIREIGVTVVRAFRRAAVPLLWYYAITVILPLANGAAKSGAAFLRHALIVFVVPPLIITVVCAGAYVFTRRVESPGRHAALE